MVVVAVVVVVSAVDLLASYWQRNQNYLLRQRRSFGNWSIFIRRQTCEISINDTVISFSFSPII